MPDPTYKYYTVYRNGKRIKVDPPAGLPVTKGKQTRLGYPFHILKKPGDHFDLMDKSLSGSLRAQASKKNAYLLHWRIQVTSIDGGLRVEMIG